MAELFAQPAPSLIGRYEVVESIGSGGMAAVYRAWARGPTGAGRPVAIKLIHQHLAGQPRFVEMFFEETRVALALTHRNIVQTFDAGEIAGRPYLVMELVEGCSLVELIGRSEQHVPLELALFIGCEVCSALSYAHNFRPEREGQPHAVVHRDVSPSNVLLSWAGDVKLADFGVARATDAARAGQSGVKGKLSYMPPEQARGDAEPRSDLFALGVVLYELIARKPLSRPMNIMQAQSRRDREPLSHIHPDVSPALEALIERCIEPDPAERPHSADELGGALWSEIDRLQRAHGGGDLRARLSAFVAALPAPPRNETVGRVAKALMAELAELSAVDARALETAAGAAVATPGARGASTAIVVLDDLDDEQPSQPMVDRTVPDARVPGARRPSRQEHSRARLDDGLDDGLADGLDDDSLDRVTLDDALENPLDDSLDALDAETPLVGDNDATVIAASREAERRARPRRPTRKPPPTPRDDERRVVGSDDEAPTKIRREVPRELSRAVQDDSDLASTRIRRLDEIDYADIEALDDDVDMDNARTVDAPAGIVRAARVAATAAGVPSARRGDTEDVVVPPSKAPTRAGRRQRSAAGKIEAPEPTQAVAPPRYSTAQRRVMQRRLGWIVLGSVALALVIIASWLGWHSAGSDITLPPRAPAAASGAGELRQDARTLRTADLE